MKFSKLFGKFFIALVVPSLMISSCALLGLEEEEEETTTAAATPTVDTSSADAIVVGSYSYTSFSSPCNQADTGVYMTSTYYLDGTTFKEGVAFSSDSTCTTSAGSSVTLGGKTFPNPTTFNTYTSASINAGSIDSGSSVTDADGNSVTSGFYIIGGTNDDGVMRMAMILLPISQTKAQVDTPGDTCEDSLGREVALSSQCTLIRGSYTLAEVTEN